MGGKNKNLDPRLIKLMQKAQAASNDPAIKRIANEMKSKSSRNKGRLAREVKDKVLADKKLLSKHGLMPGNNGKENPLDKMDKTLDQVLGNDFDGVSIPKNFLERHPVPQELLSLDSDLTASTARNDNIPSSSNDFLCTICGNGLAIVDERSGKYFCSPMCLEVIDKMKKNDETNKKMKEIVPCGNTKKCKEMILKYDSKICDKCNSIWYCNKKCSKDDHKRHKKQCAKLAKKYYDMKDLEKSSSNSEDEDDSEDERLMEESLNA